MNRGYIFLLFATLFFSSMEVVLKLVAQDFHPMQINCARFLIGGMLLFPFALRGLKKHGAHLTISSWKNFFLLGFCGIFVSMMLYQCSILYMPASAVSVLFSCNPVLVLLFAWLILRSRILPQHIIALLLEITGALFIINPLQTHLDPFGVDLVLLSAAAFALYAVLGKKACAQYSGVAVTCFSCLAGSAEMLLLIGLSHVPAVAQALSSLGLERFACIPFLQGYTTHNLAVFLYICVGVTAGGYACFFLGMEATSPMQGSLVFFFKPVLAPLLAMFVLGETIPLAMWTGIAIILIASLISMLPTLHLFASVFPMKAKSMRA